LRPPHLLHLKKLTRSTTAGPRLRARRSPLQPNPQPLSLRRPNRLPRPRVTGSLVSTHCSRASRTTVADRTKGAVIRAQSKVHSVAVRRLTFIPRNAKAVSWAA
jgi:hypothetical protein